MKGQMPFNPYATPYQSPYQTMKQEIYKNALRPTKLANWAKRNELIMLIDVLQNDLVQIKKNQATLQARLDKSGIPR